MTPSNLVTVSRSESTFFMYHGIYYIMVNNKEDNKYILHFIIMLFVSETTREAYNMTQILHDIYL